MPKRRTRKKLPRTIRKSGGQSGTRKSVARDRSRKALKPGTRISKSNKVYSETRRNRSDLRNRL